MTGVGGFVLNDKNELLLIQEKYLTSLRRPIWKIPGGLADPGIINTGYYYTCHDNLCFIMILRYIQK